jgi:hypothetical protein
VARLRSPADIAHAAQRRTVIPPVEVVERDGREYRLVRLALGHVTVFVPRA